MLFKHLLLSLISLIIFFQASFSTEAPQTKEYLKNSKFQFGKSLVYDKVKIHNIKISSINQDSILITLSVSLMDINDTINLDKSIRDFASKDIGIYIDSSYIGHPFKIECSKDTAIKEGLDLGLLVDVSGSMSWGVSPNDFTPRISALKNSLNNFLLNIKENDKVFLEGFDHNVYLYSDWTNDQSSLIRTVNNLMPMGGTMVFGGVLSAIDKVNSGDKASKAVIVFSDGGNNCYPIWSMNLLKDVVSKTANTKLYLIGLDLGNDPFAVDARIKMKILADLTGGKYIDVYSSSELDSVYMDLSKEVINRNYCKISFKAKVKDLYSLRLIDLLIKDKNDFSYCTEIPFIDIFQKWYQVKECSNCMRVRFCSAYDDNEYSTLYSAVKSFGYRIRERENKQNFDIVSESSFATIEEANMFMEEFKVYCDVYPNRIPKNKINLSIVYDYEESMLPEFEPSMELIQKLLLMGK